ncbi:MAG: hypothetical protein ACLQU3_07790 [Limisphaerales bacterium]
MDTSKWLVVLGYIGLVIGYVLWIAEAKWRDTKSRPKKVTIIICAVLWGLVTAAVGFVNWNTITHQEKAPRFAFFLDFIPLTNNACITIPTTNDYVTLVFSVYNVGESEAESLKLLAAFPRVLNIIPSGKWQEFSLFDTNRTAI